MLESLKDRVIAVAVKAQREGLCKHKSGNFSARDPETGYIVISPTGMDRELLKTDDMVVMDLDANVIENKTGLKPTSEAMMHLVIYKTRPDVMGIVHTHSLYATAFACLNRPVPAVSYEMLTMNAKKARIPVAPYGRPGSMTLANSVKDVCLEADGFLLQAHGAVAVDPVRVEEAYLKASYVEELAELAYRVHVLAAGQEIPLMPVEELQKWSYPKEIHLKD